MVGFDFNHDVCEHDLKPSAQFKFATVRGMVTMIALWLWSVVGCLCVWACFVVLYFRHRRKRQPNALDQHLLEHAPLLKSDKIVFCSRAEAHWSVWALLVSTVQYSYQRNQKYYSNLWLRLLEDQPSALHLLLDSRPCRCPASRRLCEVWWNSAPVWDRRVWKNIHVSMAEETEEEGNSRFWIQKANRLTVPFGWCMKERDKLRSTLSRWLHTLEQCSGETQTKEGARPEMEPLIEQVIMQYGGWGCEEPQMWCPQFCYDDLPRSRAGQQLYEQILELYKRTNCKKD